MIGLTRALRVWAWPAPVDMRKGFNGLAGLVGSQAGLDLTSGDYFLFVNRDATVSKTLLWDGTGLCIYQKKLSRGHFARLWRQGDTRPLRLTASELGLFLDGAKLAGKLPLSAEEIVI